MHQAQHDFCRAIIKAQDMESRVRVLDIGSLDINGNNRDLFREPFEYVGVDVAPGKNVDVVLLGHEYKSDKPFDVVISTEALEHDPFINWTINNMYQLLRQGGLMVITCATTGRPEHGTDRASPEDNPLRPKLWKQYYKNITISMLFNAIEQEWFSTLGVVAGNNDLYFYGVKK